MQIRVEIDPACREPELVVRTAEMKDEVRALLDRLSAPQMDHITGFSEDGAVILQLEDILCFFASGQKVYARTPDGEFVVRMRLYELEQKLEPRGFVRISNSEIIRLKAVRRFDLSLAGTICVQFFDKTTTYVSRRYVTKIRQVLGI